jgi:hypothetical protein
MAKKKMTQAEKDAYDMFKKLLDKPTKLKNSDFTPGSLLMFAYDAKDKFSAYDGRPLCLVLRHSKAYTLGLNFNWMPPKMREKVLDGIMKQNKKNIKKGLPITVSYSTVKRLIKGLGPVIRLYINKRISPKGVVVPGYQYYKVTNLRSEHFIGISAKSAWAAAIANKKAKKKAKIAAAKQRKKDAITAQKRINKKKGDKK